MTSKQSRLAVVLAITTSVALALCAVAHAGQPRPSPPPVVKIGLYSENTSSSEADAHATIHAHSQQAGHQRSAESPGALVTRTTKRSSTQSTTPAVTYPTLPATSQLAQDPTPLGPGSFWYPDGSGRDCIYKANSVLPCYTLTSMGGKTGIDVGPQQLAASAAAQLDLTPGEIETSPARTGVTGTASWFWLTPAPAEQTATVSLAGETVTVDATPNVNWQFGDGSDGTGPGVPYRSGSPPADAVTHSYQTRCLPGDQGHDPNVLASCGSDGYHVTATVSWSFTYHATGPVAASGTLPTRSTSTAVDYPVSEVRAFLTGSLG